MQSMAVFRYKIIYVIIPVVVYFVYKCEFFLLTLIPLNGIIGKEVVVNSAKSGIVWVALEYVDLQRKYFQTHGTNCSAVFEGNLAELKRAERFMDPNSDQLIVNFTEYFSSTDCWDLVYPSYRPVEEEQSFPLAFSILEYKNPRQLVKLFRTIYRPWNIYCFHIDNKTTGFDYIISKYTHFFVTKIIWVCCFQNENLFSA